MQTTSFPVPINIKGTFFLSFLSLFPPTQCRPQLATMAHCPLLTSRAVEFLHRKLTQDQFLFWRDLGTYWSTPAESWPRDLPLPGDFQVKFADGCVPPNLHNTSDRPSNFPTLDTLPRHQRGPDYSDAYDAEQQGEGGAGGQSSLMINPAVAEAVAAQVTTPIQSVATAAAPANKKAVRNDVIIRTLYDVI